MKNPYIQLIVRSWYFAREKRTMFVLAIVCFIFANAAILTQPYIFGQILNVLQRGGPSVWGDFVFYLVIYTILPLCFWIFHGIGRIMERSSAFYIGKNFKEYIFSLVTELPFAWHSDNHSGETINKINKATGALERFNDDSFVYIQIIVRFFGSLGGIALVSWYMGIVAAISGIVIIGLVLFFDKKLVPQYARIFNQEHRVASLLHDYVSNIRTVITLHFETLAKHELVSKIQSIFPIKKENFILNEFKWFSVEMVIAIIAFIIIFFYGYFSLKNTGIILAGNLVILYQYLERFSSSFHSFAWAYESIVKMNSELSTVDSIIQEHKNLPKIENSSDIDSFETIALKNWNFSYNAQSDKKTLKDISMELKKGQRIAFIGESGSGKSTMTALIKGLYVPQSGSLRIDGKEIDNLSLLSKMTTLIPQDPEIFENTIVYNVTFGIESPEKDVYDAIRLAKFDPVLQRLPQGIDTDIKEKGVNLSGGEKQRLALARGLFMAKNRDIIIMDEPTSSVDPVNEIAIYKNIFKEHSGACIISSVHKLHLLPLFDMIYIFDSGEIIESGSFDSLVARGGKFTELWNEYTQTTKDTLTI